jgi:hypothetical protein
MGKIKLKLLRIVFYSDLHATRLILAFAEILWAVTLLAPGKTFGRPTYHMMEHIIENENIWAAVWIFSVVMQGYILVTGRYHERFSVIFAGFNMMLWWVVTVSMYLSVSPPPAAISGETALALGASWVYLRSGWMPKEYRRSHADICA